MERAEKIRKLLKRIHQNAWSNLKEKLSLSDEEIEKDFYQNLSSFNPLKKFKRKNYQILLSQIEDAFENKKNISIFEEGQKRKFNLETKLCEDGVFRAWFSSEYSGCANGDYYLMLNPKCASFGERD